LGDPVTRSRKIAALASVAVLGLLVAGVGAYTFLTTQTEGIFVLRTAPADEDVVATCGFVRDIRADVKKWGGGFIAIMGSGLFWATCRRFSGMRRT